MQGYTTYSSRYGVDKNSNIESYYHWLSCMYNPSYAQDSCMTQGKVNQVSTNAQKKSLVTLSIFSQPMLRISLHLLGAEAQKAL